MSLKYDHIIWDWNGTLLDDVGLCLEIINGVLRSVELPPLTLEKYREIFTFPVRDYYEAAGIDFSVHSFEKLGWDWMNEYERRKYEASLFGDVRPVLAYLREHGIKSSILSAYTLHGLLNIVEKNGVKENFEYISGLDNIWAASKLENGKMLVEKIRKDHEKILMVGDTLHDHEVADEIGVDSILIASGHQSYERLKSAGVPVFHSLNEFFRLELD